MKKGTIVTVSEGWPLPSNRTQTRCTSQDEQAEVIGPATVEGAGKRGCLRLRFADGIEKDWHPDNFELVVWVPTEIEALNQSLSDIEKAEDLMREISDG